MEKTVSFENTEIAFSGKSDRDLVRAYWLFRLIGHPPIMRVGKALTKVGLALHLPIRGIVKQTIFKQFCGGENINDSADTAMYLKKYNIGTILDFSVEGQENDRELDAVTKEILATVHTAGRNEHIPFCVFKPSGISPNDILQKVSQGTRLSAADQERFRKVQDRFDQICSAAHEAGTPVFIDAEESWIQPAIDTLATEMMRRYNKEKAVVYNTIQLYRKDRLEFLKQSYAEAEKDGFYLGEKLVRGAYMEKERERAIEKKYPSPIHETKADTDNAFNEALKFCVEHLDRISFCAGTHNEESSALLVELMAQHNIARGDKRIYFAQLFGMSDHISFNLSAHRYCVAKYVPYGPVKKVLPYLIRRAEENTSVEGQTGRELKLIMRERERRKMQK